MKTKKLLAGLLSFTMAAATLATPLGGTINGVLDNFSLSANAETAGDYEYDVLDDGTVEITSYVGSDTNVVIPSEINGKKVTSIGYHAFSWCESLTSVTIGNKVTSIEEYAFSECTNLTSITIPNSVTSIGNYAFEECTSLKSVTIGNSVTSIGSRAFYGCTSLTSVTIPKSVESIEDCAFGYIYDSDSREHIKIDSFKIKCYKGTEGLKYAKNNKLSFEILDPQTPDYEYITNDDGENTITITGYIGAYDDIKIPAEIDGKKVTSIGDDAFRSCTSLTSVTIPNSVTDIGHYAFYDCTNLTNITIPNSVTSIGESAFEDTKWLENKQKENPLVIVNNILIDGSTCKGKVVIPNTVKVINDGAFEGVWDSDEGKCISDITSVTIPNSVKSIGPYAFSGCTSLASITIGNSVTSIEDWTFSGCTSLASVTIPDSVTSIGMGAFQSCTSLTNITIPNSVTNIGIYVFNGTKWLENKQKANPLVIVNNILIDGYTCEGNVVIPNTVKFINACAFGGHTFPAAKITKITIPGSVISIGNSAFVLCVNLKEVTIENGVKSIGYSAFKYCTNLTSINIPDSVTKIDGEAFTYCGNLTNVRIGNSVTSIGIGAFLDCTSLTSITIGNSVTRIGDSAFSGCESLTSVTIPNSVTSIGAGAFFECTSLTSVTIPKSVESIGDYAFGYYGSDYIEYIEYIKIDGFKIKCYAGTAGEKYAKDNGFDYELIKEECEHSYTSKVTKAATCTATGVKTFTCTNCGDTYTETIPAAGHKYQSTIVSPTYLVEGYTLHKCSACGDSYKDTITAVKKVPVISGAKTTGTTYNSVKVAWNKNNYVNGYVLYRYDDAKKSWVRLTKISNPNTTSYTVTGLASAKQHQIAVKGYITENGKEIGSPKLSLIKATTNPGVVSNFKASGYTTNSVKLTWNKVNGAEGYIVYRYNPSNKGWIRLTKTKGTSYTATGLASGTSYKFAVKSYITLNGKEFGGSQLTQVFTSTNPDKVNFTVKSPSAGRATFSWSKVRGATGYIVYYKANAKDSWHRLTVTSGTSYTKTGLKRGNNYIFTVKAYKTTGSVTYNGAFTAKTLKIK